MKSNISMITLQCQRTPFNLWLNIMVVFMINSDKSSTQLLCLSACPKNHRSPDMPLFPFRLMMHEIEWLDINAISVINNHIIVLSCVCWKYPFIFKDIGLKCLIAKGWALRLLKFNWISSRSVVLDRISVFPLIWLGTPNFPTTSRNSLLH